MKGTKLTIRPGKALRGRLRMPGDKSISHRALLLGAIADGRTQVENLLAAGDCLATLQALRALGVDAEQGSATSVSVHGRGLRGLREPPGVLDCARSATTMRLVAGLAAGQRFLTVLSGHDQLLGRPMGRVVEPLRRMGATILGRDGGQLAPLAIQGGRLRGIEHELTVPSAQVKSALLLAGLYAQGPTTIVCAAPSRDHTERMLLAMGAPVALADGQVSVRPVDGLSPLELTVPGDFSSAAFLIVAATLVPGSEISIDGVGVNPTRTGLLDALASMGATVTVDNWRSDGGEPVADLTVRASELTGATVQGALTVRTVDELPILTIAATQAAGQSEVRDAAEMRVKESDRIAATVEGLRLFGADITPSSDGFVVRGPTPLRGCAVPSYGDHRLAMAFVVAGLVASGETVVHGMDLVSDSYPGFAEALAGLGAELT